MPEESYCFYEMKIQLNALKRFNKGMPLKKKLLLNGARPLRKALWVVTAQF